VFEKWLQVIGDIMDTSANAFFLKKFYQLFPFPVQYSDNVSEGYHQSLDYATPDEIYDKSFKATIASKGALTS